jgi:hypothetical protein
MSPFLSNLLLRILGRGLLMSLLLRAQPKQKPHYMSTFPQSDVVLDLVGATY